MLKSMTAYGRSTLISPLGKFVVELQSVNRKHLEIVSYLPKEFTCFDGDIKKWISQEVGRGQVNVKIRVSFERSAPSIVAPNLALARQLKTAWEKMSHELKMPLSPEKFWLLLASKEDIFLYDENMQDLEAYKEALAQAVSKALQQLLTMKLYEGEVLLQDILARFARLEVLISVIAENSHGATERHRKKLLERLQEVLGGSLENEERVLREVCVYAERIDISEEITRFNSHLTQVKKLLSSPDKQGVGKTLEFLVQELNREANTIGSKCSEIEISKAVIEIKSELERIREQIQNIE